MTYTLDHIDNLLQIARAAVPGPEFEAIYNHISTFDPERMEGLLCELHRLNIENAALQSALAPFVKLAAFWLERDELHGIEDKDTCVTEIEFGHLRTAARVVEELGQKS